MERTAAAYHHLSYRCAEMDLASLFVEHLGHDQLRARVPARALRVVPLPHCLPKLFPDYWHT